MRSLFIPLFKYKQFKHPTNQPIKEEEVISIRKAVQDVDIRAIHPDKLETFAADLVNKLKNEHQPKT